MRKSVIVLTLGLLVASSVGSQSASDFDARYKRVTAYEVEPGIVMTAEYSVSGQVCDVTLERRQETDTGIILGDSFSGDDVDRLVNEIVPRAERGKPTKGTGRAQTSSGIIIMTDSYENVIVDKMALTDPKPGGILLIQISWRHRTCKNSNARLGVKPPR